MADTQTPSAEKMEEVAKKLAEFRNTLPENEQVMMDSLVARATKQPQPEEGEVVVPSESEVMGLAEKLQNFRDTLSEEERPLVDGVVVAAGAVEEEVTGHQWRDYYRAWSLAGHISLHAVYAGACFARSGRQSLHTYSPWWLGGFAQYTCYDQRWMP